MIGHCYYKMQIKSPNKTHLDHAFLWLTRALLARYSLALPTDDLESLIHKLKSFYQKENSKKNNHQYWSLFLSPDEYSNLMTLSHKDPSYTMRTLDVGAQHDDLVMLFSQQDKGPYRLVALCLIIGNKIWHPIFNYQYLTENIYTFSEPIFVPKYLIRRRKEKYRASKISTVSLLQLLQSIDLQHDDTKTQKFSEILRSIKAS